MASAVGQPLDVDRATYDKTRPSTARVKVEVNLLRILSKRIRVQFNDLVTGEITNVWQKIRCKHQGHREADCRTLTDGEVDAMSSRQSCNSIDSVGVEEQLVVHSNQQNNKSKDTQFAQKINEVKDNEIVAENSSMRQSDKHTPGELHDAIQAIKSNAPLENLAIDGKEKIAESERGNLKPLEVIDLQVEISSCDENATGNWNTIAQKKSISMCIGSSVSRSKSPRLENKQQLIDSNPSKEKTLVQADPDNNIQSVNTPIGVCSMRTDKYGNVMSPTVAKAIQKSQAAMLLKPNSAIKPPMVTLSILAHEVTSQNLDSLDEHQGEFGQLLSSTGNDKILAKGMSPLSQANFTNDLLISKEKQQGEMSTPRWADLVDEEENVSPPLLNRKLSPQALEFVPKSTIAKKNEQETLASGFSPINAYASDLGDDSFDEGEDEDEDEDMLDICFDKVARDGDISPRHQRSGSKKKKKKIHGRQHSWDGKVTGEFVPRHLPMRLTKQNHMTVSIASTRSNTFKKQ
ncbi:hypothetical protein KY289_036599 [Solanum tuberosum]|nr:hypothetical protein KY289_036599 [Solanum tuberosum]